MVSDDAKGSVASRRSPGTNPGEFCSALDEWREQIRIEIADFALEDCGEAFEARPRVNRGLWQGLKMRLETIAFDVAEIAYAVELHEDEIPDFDVAAAFAAEFAVGVALVGRGGAHVVVKFAAGGAW